MKRPPFAAIALAVCIASTSIHAYQTYGVRLDDGRVVEVKWGAQPIRYYITNRGVPNVSAEDFRAAVARAFGSWQGVAGASVSTEFLGFTSAEPFEDDGRITLGFQDRPDLDRVLGAATFLLDRVTGEIVECDIFFNSAFQWSVSAAGDDGRFDLESIVLHETGHLFGLGHSALGETEMRSGGGRAVIAKESVMFPIAFSPGTVLDRTPKVDDAAGFSSLYPTQGESARTGTIGGRVTKDGAGVLGAHVVAFNPKTGALVGGVTVNDRGAFSIERLEPGSYVLRVEPIDDADLDSFFDDPTGIDVNFRVAFHEALVTVAKGGGTAEIVITVVGK